MTGIVPLLTSERLVFRPFSTEDAPRVQLLLSDAEVTGSSFNMPYPYPDGAAETWIAGQAEAARNGDPTWAICTAADEVVIGAIGLAITDRHHRADLGYWLGRPHWGTGYGTEAARRIAAYAIDDLGLSRIEAKCFTSNVASARILEKIGMEREGTLRQYLWKNGTSHDVYLYATIAGATSGHRS